MRDAMPLSAIAPAPKGAAFRLNFSETRNQKSKCSGSPMIMIARQRKLKRSILNNLNLSSGCQHAYREQAMADFKARWIA
jgi:hypothetical protein